MAVNGGGGVDMGLVTQVDPQLLSPGKMAVGCQRRLEVHRHGSTIWQKLVVDVLLCCLSHSTGARFTLFIDEYVLIHYDLRTQLGSIEVHSLELGSF